MHDFKGVIINLLNQLDLLPLPTYSPAQPRRIFELARIKKFND